MKKIFTYSIVSLFSLMICCTNIKTNSDDNTLIDSNYAIGNVNLIIPNEWDVLSGIEEKEVYETVEVGVKDMINNYDSEMIKSFHGINDFLSVRLPDKLSYLIIYSMAIPPQKNYLQNIEKESHEKVNWGLKNNVIKEVIKIGQVEIDSTKLFNMHTVMNDGKHAIGYFYWTPEKPSLVSHINFILTSKSWKEYESEISETINSIRINKNKEEIQ